MGGTRPARDLYTVAIAPPRPDTFLAPSTNPQAFESLPDARYGGDVVLSAWLTPRSRCRATAGATGIKQASFFRAAAEQTLRPLSLFLFLLLHHFYTGYARGPASSVLLTA